MGALVLDADASGAEVSAAASDAVPEGTALPGYTVRVSARARHVRLTVSARDGLVVVVPRGHRVDAHAIVSSKQEWARRALAAVAERRAVLTAGPEALMPRTVDLPAIAVTYPVYERAAARATAKVIDGALVVSGGTPGDRLHALRTWLGRTAREYLPQRVHDLAGQTGLTPSKVRVTQARTRWGSCSARGTVSLSRSALFLPPNLCDALVLHELAHLRELNHSNRFWVLLRRLDPHADAHRAALSRSRDHIPPWADC